MAQTRPEPMNASPHHAKVKVTLKVPDPLFAAGGNISGKMDVECRADKGLGLSVIMVELFAIEELTSRDHSATSTFMHSRRIFQQQGLPPSNAVLPHPLPGEEPLPAHHWPARRGQTSFLFQFPLPPSAPASIDFGKGLATLRYEVRASVGVAWKGERKLVTDKKLVNVVESLPDEGIPPDPEAVVVGEHGKMWVQGRLLGGLLVAGESACIELQVKNHSAKKNTGLSLALNRHLHLSLPQGENSPLQLSDTLTSVNFRGPEYTISPGVEGVATLVFDVPRSATGVSGGLREDDDDEEKVAEPLFEVRCVVAIRISMGIGNKDIHLDLPVKVAHPMVMPPAPEPYAMSPPIPYAAASPALAPPPPMSPAPLSDPRPQSPFAYPAPAHTPGPILPHRALSPAPPMSPVPFDPRPVSPYARPLPVMSPAPPQGYPYHQSHTPAPMFPYHDHNRVWLPPPSQTPNPYAFFNPPLHSHAPPEQYFLPAPISAYTPPRSMSAAPPSLPSGLPSSATAAPPIILGAAPEVFRKDASEGTREEGKGLRASRVSHHLRMSSRHRSASPPAHRHAVPFPVQPQPTGGSIHDAAPAPVVVETALPPISTSQLSDGLSSPTRSRKKGTILSPRPVLSPQNSFALEPATKTPSGGIRQRRLSTNVEVLEKMAADVAKRTVDLSGDLPRVSRLVKVEEDETNLVKRPVSMSDVDLQRTLPGPPVPSGKERMLSAVAATRPRADNLFIPELAPALPGLDLEPEAATPRTPTLAAFSPRKLNKLMVAAAGADEEENALDALERRLIDQVGTRKPEQERRPDVRNVVQPIAIPAPRGSGSGATAGTGGLGPAGGPQTPLNESAISSLTLSGGGRSLDERTQYRGQMGGGGKTVIAGGEESGTPRERKGAKKRDKDRGSKDKEDEAAQLRNAAKGRVAAWLEMVSTSPGGVPLVDSISPSPDLERARLAVESDEPSKQAVTSPKLSPRPSPLREPRGLPDVSPRKSPRPLSRANSAIALSNNVESEEVAKVGEQAPPDDEAAGDAKIAKETKNAAPNPRSSGFVSMADHARNQNLRQSGFRARVEEKSIAGLKLRQFPPLPTGADGEPAKYDVRSARGGRGGKVTAVAAMWAQVAAAPPTSNIKSNTSNLPSQASPAVPAPAPAKVTPPITSPLSGKPSTPTPILQPNRPKPIVSLPRNQPPTFADKVKANPPPRMKPLQQPAKAAAVTSSVDTTAAVGLGDLSAHRARMIKSTSVPAMVSSSHATPTLSSTASLVQARPEVPARVAKVKLPPTIPENTGNAVVADKPAAVAGDLAFGKARLRDLIKKYQGQPAS